MAPTSISNVVPCLRLLRRVVARCCHFLAPGACKEGRVAPLTAGIIMSEGCKVIIVEGVLWLRVAVGDAAPSAAWQMAPSCSLAVDACLVGGSRCFALCLVGVAAAAASVAATAAAAMRCMRAVGSHQALILRASVAHSFMAPLLHTPARARARQHLGGQEHALPPSR